MTTISATRRDGTAAEQLMAKLRKNRKERFYVATKAVAGSILTPPTATIEPISRRFVRTQPEEPRDRCD